MLSIMMSGKVIEINPSIEDGKPNGGYFVMDVSSWSSKDGKVTQKVFVAYPEWMAKQISRIVKVDHRVGVRANDYRVEALSLLGQDVFNALWLNAEELFLL